MSTKMQAYPQIHQEVIQLSRLAYWQVPDVLLHQPGVGALSQNIGGKRD